MDKKILIIEDEPDIANVFKKQLELKGGYEIAIASDGRQGLEMMNQGKYDLVFLDLIMPEMDGIEILRELKSNPGQYGQVPVMALTNVTSEEVKKEVEELGAVRFIVKTDTDIERIVDDFFGANGADTVNPSQ